MEMQVNDQERLTRKRLRRCQKDLELALAIIEVLLNDVEDLEDRLEQSERLRLANQ